MSGASNNDRVAGFTGPEFYRIVIRRKDFEWSEAFMLRVLAEPRNAMETYWAVGALSEVGSLASVPQLKSLLTHKKVDVRIVSLITIAHLAGSRETGLYVDCLTGAWYRQPWAAMHCLQLAADPSSLSAVLEWLRKHRSALRGGRMDGQLAMELAIYLYRQGASEAFADVRDDVRRAWLARGFRKYRGYEAVLSALGVE